MTLADEAATRALGARIAGALRVGDAVLLSGPLGAGKTALARAVIQASGITGHVPSPTFTLVQHYETADLTIRHFDLYRIEREIDLAELGLEDALEDGAVLAEWPERAADYWPETALHIELKPVGEQTRIAHIRGGEYWRRVVDGI
ncbi:MAG: hypothetical protein RJB62_1417 [Pseudomonadota bacterium]